MKHLVGQLLCQNAGEEVVYILILRSVEVQLTVESVVGLTPSGLHASGSDVYRLTIQS